MITENIPSRSGFSSLRAFHPWSRIYRSPSGSLKKYFLSARIGRPIQLYYMSQKTLQNLNLLKY